MENLNKNGISSKGTSLLHKMGRLRAFEMLPEALLQMVTLEQRRRSFQRAIGRTLRAAKGKSKPKIKTLESLGLAPEIITRLRASGVKEETLIIQIQKAGLL
jgi:hypothetical protein